MMFGIGLLCFCYAPLLFLLKSPPTKEEKKVGTEGVDNLGVDVGDEMKDRISQELTVAAKSYLTKL
jgi:hypothetical protein